MCVMKTNQKRKKTNVHQHLLTLHPNVAQTLTKFQEESTKENAH